MIEMHTRVFVGLWSLYLSLCRPRACMSMFGISTACRHSRGHHAGSHVCCLCRQMLGGQGRVLDVVEGCWDK